MSYLDLNGFKGLSVMPASDIDEIEAVASGWVQAQLDYWSSWIDARLTKRYEAPFEAPFPVAVTGWLARIVTLRCYLRRGVDPNDPQFEEIRADADAAREEIREAADSEVGLFELPLREDTTASGVSRGGPRGYSEASPYVGFDVQSAAGRDEDAAGRGTDG